MCTEVQTVILKFILKKKIKKFILEIQFTLRLSKIYYLGW